MSVCPEDRRYACLACLAAPTEPCGHWTDPLLPANLPGAARVDYNPGPGSTRPLGPPIDFTPGTCWDCRCPYDVGVHREGTEQLVCRDCADLFSSPWGCLSPLPASRFQPL